MGQADAGDNEAKLMTKLAPEWVRTSDPVIRSPARYRWTTAPAERRDGDQEPESSLDNQQPPASYSGECDHHDEPRPN